MLERIEKKCCQFARDLVMNLFIVAFLCFISKVITIKLDISVPWFNGLVCLRENNDTNGKIYLVQKHGQMFLLKFDPKGSHASKGVRHKGSASLYPLGFLVNAQALRRITASKVTQTVSRVNIEQHYYNANSTYYVRQAFRTNFDLWKNTEQELPISSSGFVGSPDSFYKIQTKIPARADMTHIITPDCQETLAFSILSEEPTSEKVKMTYDGETFHEFPFNGSHHIKDYFTPRFVIAKSLTGPTLYDDDETFVIYKDGKWNMGKYRFLKDNYYTATNTYGEAERFPFVFKGIPGNYTWKFEMDSMFHHECQPRSNPG